ncbi:MAG: head maturation protease, ClpP-related [Bellilinea sp.]
MKNHKPVRVFEGKTQPYERFWQVVNAAESDSGEPEIEFYGYISEWSWWDDDITPAKFKSDLYDLGGGGPVTVRIHSGGGEVFAASAIRSMIMDYPGRVTTIIDGLCASAATFVAMAGDRVLMHDAAFFMIHDPWVSTWGTADELQSAAEMLRTIKQGIIEAYQAKTNLETSELDRMMAVETWLTAKEAQDMGFVDEVITSSKVFDRAAVANAIKNFTNVPPELLQSSEQELANADEILNPSDAGEDAEPPREGIDEREAERLRDYLDIFAKEQK